MIILPAIDIQNGNVVRLIQGKFDEATEYSGDPVSVAKLWEKKGAPWLHLVDLDGAKAEHMANLDIILNIVKSVNIPVEMGGGIRTKEDIKTLIDGGVARVILGTRATQDLDFLKEIVEQWKDKIAISLDCHNGMIAQRGWVETSDLKAADFIKKLEAIGVKCVIHTDIARDGMLNGPNIEALKELLAVTNIPMIASGGVSSISDIKALKELESSGLFGVITGKAIYEGKLDLEEALKIC